MRLLLVARGIPGSGKSTFLAEQGLDMYTLSPDAIRLMDIIALRRRFE
mgnify:CR=1 FL=1